MQWKEPLKYKLTRFTSQSDSEVESFLVYLSELFWYGTYFWGTFVDNVCEDQDFLFLQILSYAFWQCLPWYDKGSRNQENHLDLDMVVFSISVPSWIYPGFDSLHFSLM